jgi:hypothetical protein
MDGRYAPTRTAHPVGYFSNFFDLQARALLRGSLALPEGSLGIEGFVVGGRTYTYFPPFPAVARLPVFLFSDSLDGKLTAPMMAVAWLVTAVGLASLVTRVRRLVRGRVPIGWGEAALYGAAMTLLLGGSILVYLASLPWVYHEVYAWAIALVVGTLASALATIERPTRLRVALLAFCTLAAVMTRSTGGWACVATMLATAWHVRARGGSAASRTLWRWIAVLAVAALASGAGVNQAKFGNPTSFTLENQVWTKLNSHRQRSLIVNHGTLVGPQFFRSSLRTYFDPTGIHLSRVFPFVSLPEATPAVSDVWIDQSYRTGSVPLFAPLAFTLAVWGFGAAFRRRPVGRLALVRVPLLGALLTTGGVMFYGYLAHRYTAEFFPVLAIGSIVGLADLIERLRNRRWLAAALCVPFALLVLAGVTTQLAISTTAAKLTYRADRLPAYLRLQARLSGPALDVLATAAVPTEARADRIAIVGDCGAVLVGTGETYEPWVVAEAATVRRSRSFSPADSVIPSRSVLATFDGLVRREVVVETDGFGSFRTIMTGANVRATPWRVIAARRDLTLAVSADTTKGRYLIEVSTGEQFEVDLASWNEDWVSAVTILEPLGSEGSVRQESTPGTTCRAVQTRSQ